MIVDALIVGAAAAFVISLIERWIFLDWVRGVVALLIGGMAMFWVFGYRDGALTVMTLASSFIAAAMVLGVERLADRPPVVLDRR